MHQPSRTASVLWWAAFSLAIGLLGVGVWLGEPTQVLMNAASVCLACMGLG